ncbi:MAG: S-adenosylmethionine decarboxylase [Chloroflexi bacterium]|nr:S-adenosylmethionine decarboxylase [Chloroflexota bacterium]
MHLVIDGYGAEEALLANPDALYQFLDEYPDAIGMTKITPPHVYVYAGQNPQDVGLSGFVIIAESHISVHTFPKRQYVNIDVFSCKEFDTQRALVEIKGRFGLQSVRSWTLERGLEYSDPSVGVREMRSDRSALLQRI